MNLGSLAQFPSAFWTRAAAPALLFDKPLRYPSLPLSIIIVYVVRVVAAVPTNLAGVELAPAAIVRLDLVAFAEAVRAASNLPDQALGDANLSFPIVVGNVVRIITAVPANLTGVEPAASTIVRFDLVAFA